MLTSGYCNGLEVLRVYADSKKRGTYLLFPPSPLSRSISHTTRHPSCIANKPIRLSPALENDWPIHSLDAFKAKYDVDGILGCRNKRVHDRATKGRGSPW